MRAMSKNILRKIQITFGIILLVIPSLVLAISVSHDESGNIYVPMSLSVTAIVNPTSNNGGGGGGGAGGGGGGGEVIAPTVVNFSGMAYPLSRVFILKDGDIAVSTIADQAAYFSVSLSGLKTNTYTFSVYGEDSNKRKSSFFSFPVFITEGTTVNISNIFLSPTIDVDKAEVKRGDNLLIFGQSAPSREIIISVHSDQEHFFNVMSNAIGGYLYNLDTTILELGKHETKSKTNLTNQLSLYAAPVQFTVGEDNKSKEFVSCFYMRGDLNCDNHVNLIDFSIMAYWYKRSNPPVKVDLSSDGRITLTDFSILAFNWTG